MLAVVIGELEDESRSVGVSGAVFNVIEQEELHTVDLGRDLPLHTTSSLFRCWRPHRSGLPQTLGAGP
jgi:hypothetical protein